MPLGNGLTYDDPYYVSPTRFKVDIKSQDMLDTFHSFNGFNDNNDIAITAIDCKRGMQQTGTWEIEVSDPERNIDRDLVDRGNIVIISTGKQDSVGHVRNLMWGFLYRVGGERELSDLRWRFIGKGMAATFAHTYISFLKNAPSETLHSGQEVFKKDPDFAAHLLVKEVLSNLDLYPLDPRTLVDRGGFDITEISELIDQIIPSVRYPMATAASVLNAIADMVGAAWTVDENNKFRFFYPESESSGIIIKDEEEDDDNGDYVAYNVGGTARYHTSIDPGDGFANMLWGTADLTSIISGEARSVAFTNLYNKDLSQMTISNAALYRDLTFVLSKVGAGTDAADPSQQRLRGYITEDLVGQDGFDHRPGPNIVATFGIKISDIKETPGPITKIDLKPVPGVKLDVGRLHWIVMQEIGSDDNNTVRWYHDNDKQTASDPDLRSPIRWSGTRNLPEGRSEGDDVSYRSWITRSTGPVYTHAFLSSQKILTTARNIESINRWTPQFPVEAEVSPSWVKTAHTMGIYLDQLAFASGQPPIVFDTMLTTIPNVGYTPGQSVQLVDKLLGFPKNRDFICQVIEDHWWVVADDYGLGNQYCEVNLKGYQSPLEYEADFL